MSRPVATPSGSSVDWNPGKDVYDAGMQVSQAVIASRNASLRLYEAELKYHGAKDKSVIEAATTASNIALLKVIEAAKQVQKLAEASVKRQSEKEEKKDNCKVNPKR